MRKVVGEPLKKEPVFVLRGSDPTAAPVVEFWVALRQGQASFKGPDALLVDALVISSNMRQWAIEHGLIKQLAAASDVALQLRGWGKKRSGKKRGRRC